VTLRVSASGPIARRPAPHGGRGCWETNDVAEGARETCVAARPTYAASPALFGDVQGQIFRNGRSPPGTCRPKASVRKASAAFFNCPAMCPQIFFQVLAVIL
jgi:hypothetical protein